MFMQISTAGRRRRRSWEENRERICSLISPWWFFIFLSVPTGLAQKYVRPHRRPGAVHHKWTEKSEAKKALLVTSGNAVNPAGT